MTAPASTTIIISHYQFTVPSPFSAGHICTPGEATALNNWFAEAMRNRTSHWLSTITPSSDPRWHGFLSPAQLAAIQYNLDSYASTYSISPRTRPVRRSLLTIELDVLDIFNTIKGLSPEEIQIEARRRLRAKIDSIPAPGDDS